MSTHADAKAHFVKIFTLLPPRKTPSCAYQRCAWVFYIYKAKISVPPGNHITKQIRQLEIA
jgi:hypothetical protein